MLFSSPIFLFFFAVYFALHVLLPLRFRLPLIIVGSSIFYGYWNPVYLWVPFLTLLIAYKGAIWIMARGEGAGRRYALTIVIFLLLLPLGIVKYTGFVYSDVIGPVLGFQGHAGQWALPLGISFITFTLIAYVVDVYCGRYHLERNPMMLGGLVLFFPHLIAGPVLRPAELLPQLHHQGRRFRTHIVFGFTIFTFGLLKKLAFADPLSDYVDRVYAQGALNFSAMDYLLAIYAFSLQIYCDFSGYTDMAIGIALTLGVRLPKNFERPYAATSVVDFWTRWHVTLSRWLRDYLYIPLGGSRHGHSTQIRNLFVTMGLGGLWHGASWNFVLWGLAHGAGISFVHTLSRFALLRPLLRAPRWLKILVTFHFVTAAWILFRAKDMQTAARIVSGPFIQPWSGVEDWLLQNTYPLAMLVIFFILHGYDSHQTIRKITQKLPPTALWPVIGLIWILCIALSQGSSAKFIYFDF